MLHFLLFVCTIYDVVSGSTVTVAPGDDTLLAAVNAAADGDILVLQDGTYKTSRNGLFDIQIKTSKSLTIRAQNSRQATVDSGGLIPVFAFENNGGSQVVTLEGLIITGGQTKSSTGKGGGGIRVSGGADVRLNNCKVFGNQAMTGGHNGGGGIFVEGASSRLKTSDCEISSNNAGYSGGGLYVRDA